MFLHHAHMVGGETVAAVKVRELSIKARLATIPESIAGWLGSSLWAALVPIGLAAPLFVLLFGRPDLLCKPLEIGLNMPSEKSISAPRPVRTIDPDDPVWRFRYAPTGTEFRSGIPYWIFRIMPAIFADQLPGGGYAQLGFDADDADYYADPDHRLPRGLALSDTVFYLPFAHTTAKLKRVSITCSGCHRGEYIKDGKRELVDGMPNHTADLQSFKRFFERAFLDPRFTPDRVIVEIDKALDNDKKPALTGEERLIYRAMADMLVYASRDNPSLWMNKRVDNGPGRIDPFNAVKFEVLKVPDDGTAATIDFPSIWNQRNDMRSWHHCDGNTLDSSARNFGSVIGVGGVALSVREEDLHGVGKWIDQLAPPHWPFAPPNATTVTAGAAAFKESCASCHGVFDRATNSMTQHDGSFMRVVDTVGTDPERWRAFRAGTAEALNEFGERNALWGPHAFRGAPEDKDYGYLAGPLDGVWARAPYLHNGSVPTIAELLKPPGDRVKCFYRGNPNYDEANVGWVYEKESTNARHFFQYCTVNDPTDPLSAPIRGNSNAGHPYTVAADKRDALIAYLKTL